MAIKELKKYKEFADPQVRPRYHGLPTFMRAPFQEDLSKVDIALVGVPFDGGVTNRAGARHGPREVRNQSSLMRKVNQATGIHAYEGLSVCDVGDAWVEQPFELEGALNEIADVFRNIHAAGVVPLSCGGDHSVSLPILRAIAAKRPVGIIHFDAHCDTGDDFLGSKFHHGAPFRRAVEEGLIDPKRSIQIGIRGGLFDANLWKFSHDAGMRVVYMEEFTDKGWRWAAEEARRVAGTGPVYVTFDVDGLDPVYAPGTGTPEAGGITMIEAQRMLRMLQGLDIVGGDVVEVAPPFDPSGLTALTGATLMFEILCVTADALRNRRNKRAS
ncbi:MAG: agmatinase [Alphaproteobacteria bacterium]